ncbi:hypothetical protein IKF15_02810 [Candidatus Saccharibacteria bacterium]|nr:hypothetical protein [Candidatus Saccharibacteria bacterium]
MPCWKLETTTDYYGRLQTAKGEKAMRVITRDEEVEKARIDDEKIIKKTRDYLREDKVIRAGLAQRVVFHNYMTKFIWVCKRTHKWLLADLGIVREEKTVSYTYRAAVDDQEAIEEVFSIFATTYIGCHKNAWREGYASEKGAFGRSRNLSESEICFFLNVIGRSYADFLNKIMQLWLKIADAGYDESQNPLLCDDAEESRSHQASLDLRAQGHEFKLRYDSVAEDWRFLLKDSTLYCQKQYILRDKRGEIIDQFDDFMAVPLDVAEATFSRGCMRDNLRCMLSDAVYAAENAHIAAPIDDNTRRAIEQLSALLGDKCTVGAP